MTENQIGRTMIAIKHRDGTVSGQGKHGIYCYIFPYYRSCINAGFFARDAEIKRGAGYVTRARTENKTDAPGTETAPPMLLRIEVIPYDELPT